MIGFLNHRRGLNPYPGFESRPLRFIVHTDDMQCQQGIEVRTKKGVMILLVVGTGGKRLQANYFLYGVDFISI